MRHVIIQIESIMKYPPTISLMKILRDLDNDVILLSSEIEYETEQLCHEIGVCLENVGYSYSPKNNAFKKLLKIPLINFGIRKAIKKTHSEDALFWIMTSISLKYIGNIKVNLSKLFNNAKAVIECEYNRAFIAQAWFGLKKLPHVIPNKPYMERKGERKKRYQVINDKYCASIVEKIKDKKIILYQGIIDQERPLEPFARAIEKMGTDYAFVVMSGNLDGLKYRGSNTYFLPFIIPPYHLEITSWAYIGILIYKPVRGATTSPLNAVYCAPNKLYEYAMYGIPMIGNNVPGLKSSICDNTIGKIFEIMNDWC